MRRLLVAAFLCILLLAGSADAMTWVIEPDGTGDAPTIQAGIDSAAAGDTVSVICGTYYEHDILMKSGICLTSETGTADCVTINAGRLGRVLDCDDVDGTTSIVGFTAANGEAPGYFPALCGGGIILWESSPRITNCILADNRADELGGGAHLVRSAAVFTNCVFADNVSLGTDEGTSVGGGVHSYQGNPTFTDCIFSGNLSWVGFGGGFGSQLGDRPAFRHCLFLDNQAAGDGGGDGGGGLGLAGSSYAELTNCTFVGNSAHNALGGGICCFDGSSASLDNCIIAFSPDEVALYWDESGAEPVLTCCDLYGNAGGDWVGPIADQYGVNGNISEDPIFCDPDNEDFYLREGSPCHTAGSCGTIGAYGLGCGFAIDSITDVECDQGGQVSVKWCAHRNDIAGSDTVVEYYSVWRRIDGPSSRSGETSAASPKSLATEPPGLWECVDSVATSAQSFYEAVCPTACDSTEYGICWSVFFIRAEGPDSVPDCDTEADSGYSVDNEVAGAWIDVSTETLAEDGWGHGVAWVDYDDDGDLDIFVANRSDEDKLIRNDDLTASGFVDATPPVLADAGDCRGAAWGDYDGDGDLDLYVSRNGANKLYRNDGGGGFTDVTTSPLDDAAIGQTVSWADYDNDGDLDLYVVNNGSNRLFRNDSVGVFTDVTSVPLGNGSHGMGSGWADYDNDGDLDLYLANYNAANALFENQGGDTFVNATTPVLAIADPSVGVAWGDYDNDGDLDLYVTNEGANNLLRNDGGVFTDVSASPTNDTQKGRSAAWADYDLDGDLDLYLVCYDGTNRLFRNEGGGSFVAPAGCGTEPLAQNGSDISSAWADYDNDGDPDLYLIKHGANKLFRNDLYQDHHWLEVRLTGIISNTYGQGARVRVVAGGTSQMREIAGASGYLSQGPLTASFGLGTATMVDTLEVTWPASGTAQILTDVTCDQRLEIVEDYQSGVGGGVEATQVFCLHACRPNPFNSVTSIRYDLPEAAHVDLEVFDVSGRLVRRLIDHRLTEPGRYTTVWNGRNDEGLRVAPGIYFMRLAAGTETEIERTILLR
jgi:hypothetical protein